MSSPVLDDLADHYHEYLDRFAVEVGIAAVGAFAKYRGSLIKKLDFEQFAAAYTEYHTLAQRYHDSVERGDTINDAVVKMLREQAAALVLRAVV
jgi:hypothetical protein